MTNDAWQNGALRVAAGTNHLVAAPTPTVPRSDAPALAPLPATDSSNEA